MFECLSVEDIVIYMKKFEEHLHNNVVKDAVDIVDEGSLDEGNRIVCVLKWKFGCL